jgi:DNA-binding PucR family transcriptional regulator
VKRSQHDFTDFEATGQLLLDSIVAAHPEYASLPEDVYADVLAANVANARVYHQVVTARRRPSDAELAQVTAGARRRVHQGVSLEALLRSYRIGARGMWHTMRESQPELDDAELTDWTLRWLDWVSSAAESAYLAERESLVNSRRDRVNVLVTRVVEGDFATSAERAAALQALGLRVEDPHVGVVADGGEQLADLIAAVTRVVPRSVGAVLRRGAVLLVPASSSEALYVVLDDVLTRLGVRAASMTVGLGRPCASAHGLAGSVREAERARTLGMILSPDRRTHPYEAIEFFDLFRDDGRVDEFVRQVLGAHLETSQRRTDLMSTLYTYFTLGMNRAAAARRLEIHPNTLDYRLRQARASYGADLTSPEYSFRFQLAVRLLPLCQSVTPSQPRGAPVGHLSDDGGDAD